MSQVLCTTQLMRIFTSGKLEPRSGCPDPEDALETIEANNRAPDTV
jgi:hypothetical protein